MLICDSESDSFKFESTKIWVIAAKDILKDCWYFSFDESVWEEWDVESLLYEEFSGETNNFFPMWHGDILKYLEESVVCFHNYFAHDKPLIKRFYPWFKPKGEEDTYILSQLLNPDREIPKGCKGAHGLEAWGVRNGIPKPEHEEWDRFSPEMLHRVIEDVKNNVITWEKLQKEKEGWDWEEAIKIEYGIADLQGRQELHGVKLDIDKAYDLADEIYQEIQKIDETLLESMPLRVIRGTEVLEPFKKDGQLKEAVRKWFMM